MAKEIQWEATDDTRVNPDFHTGQPNLFEGVDRRHKLRIAFEKFHDENPHIYELFKKYTFEAINIKGFKHQSASFMVGLIRWYSQTSTTDPEYKIANAHSPFYSRMFMAEFPEHDGFFRTAQSIADEE
jgi:hypothetical protein